MKIDSKYPQNNLLKKYIHLYYASKIDNDRYIAFPHFYFPTCIINNASFHYHNHQLTIEKDLSTGLSFYAVNVYKEAIEIYFKDNFEAFNIVFKPYGLAQFKKGAMNFKNDVLLDYTALLQPFFDEHTSFHSYSLEEKISHIEEYLLSIISIKNHTNTIKNRIDDLIINDFKDTFHSGISEKTFYRAFKNICGEPPSTLYNIIRLRKAMQYIAERTNSERLTDISYALNYFDQAHFTNVFKKLTQRLPKDFPNNLTYLANDIESEKFFFEFIDNVR